MRIGKERTNRTPGRGGGVGVGRRHRQVRGECEVRDAHHPHSRVTVRGAVTAELLQVAAGHPDAGLFEQLPPGGVNEILVDVDKATRQGRTPRVKLLYFQWLAVLFSEWFLDRYFSDAEALSKELNAYLNQRVAAPG